MNEKAISKKIKSLPADLQKEADSFVDYLIFKDGKKQTYQKRKPGMAKGLIELKEGFNDPLEDFGDYMNK
jgi:hypothetical protein